MNFTGGLFNRTELRVGDRRRTELADAVEQMTRVADVLDAAPER